MPLFWPLYWPLCLFSSLFDQSLTSFQLETEPQKILGEADHVTAAHTPSPFTVCATCNRVPVIDGHTECVIVTLKKKTTVGHVVKCLQEYTCEAQEKGVPSAPTQWYANRMVTWEVYLVTWSGMGPRGMCFIVAYHVM